MKNTIIEPNNIIQMKIPYKAFVKALLYLKSDIFYRHFKYLIFHYYRCMTVKFRNRKAYLVTVLFDF